MVKLAILVKRRSGMSYREFVDYHRDIHLPLLTSISETRRFIRRFVTSRPVATAENPEPGYDVMVELWFDSLDDLQAYFASDGFLQKVDPDHANFIDLSSVVRMVTEEQVVIA